MGVTIGNRNRSFDLGYGDFANLRRQCARAADEGLGKLYDEMFEEGRTWTKGEWTNYDARANAYLRANATPDGLAKFLYEPDAGGKLTAKECRELFAALDGRLDPDLAHGYVGARFTNGEFLDALKECASKRLVLRWS